MDHDPEEQEDHDDRYPAGVCIGVVFASSLLLWSCIIKVLRWLL